MTDKTEMVLVSRDELQQLIGASVRCAFEEYRQEQAPQDTSEFYTIRQLAEKWGVSIATIWRHEKLGHIKGQRKCIVVIISRNFFFDRKVLLD